jgi:predicted kinase
MEQPELVILMGLQAAGKSSFHARRYAATHELVSRDLLPSNRRPAARQLELVAAALREGRSVLVDNTNPTPPDRAPFIALGRAAGARVIGYFFVTTVADSLRRNADRTGRARVPPVALYVTAKKLRPPSYDEGFDELFAVRIVEGDGGDAAAQAFEIAPWPR